MAEHPGAVGALDRRAPRRHAELPVDREGLGLHRVRRQVQALGDLPEGEVGGQQRQDPQLGRGEGRAANALPSDRLDLGSQLVSGLISQHAEVGSLLEDVGHLPEDGRAPSGSVSAR